MKSTWSKSTDEYEIILDCVHTMPAHFENGEKFDGLASRSHENGTFLPADFENGRF